MVLTLYNTETRQKQPFVPNDAHHVTMYVCGPTVYDYAHIGNARPVVVFDVLYRLLQQRYNTVRYVRNITDIDDKIIERAIQSNQEITTITQFFTNAYQEDMKALGAVSPTIEPKATDHLPQMINLIERLIAKGHAYVADKHVLYSTHSFDRYGFLSKREDADILEGARIEVAGYKQNPRDFVLWKPSIDNQPAFDSPWGQGRPGWHIECSAMIYAHLGATIDIHGGGQDLIFPHHENECAQSCAGYDVHRFVGTWLHNGFLTINGQKMSKSLGNFLTVRGLRDTLRGEVIRYVLLSAHYRQPLDWNDTAIHQATQNLNRLYQALGRYKEDVTGGVVDIKVVEALDDDINTPVSLNRLQQVALEMNKAVDRASWLPLAKTLKASATALGLMQQSPAQWFQGSCHDTSWIEAKIKQRALAKKAKDFATADSIRQDLLDQGIVLEDTSTGTTWKQVEGVS
jgi:cysteinyl-tRNA synthetase